MAKRILTLFTILVGVFVVSVSLQILKRIFLDNALPSETSNETTSVSTAVCKLFIGVAFLFPWQKKFSLFLQGCCGLIIVLALIPFLEYLLGIDLPWDNWIANKHTPTSVSHMAFNTSIALILSAMSLYCLMRSISHDCHRLTFLSSIFSAFVISIAILALIGHSIMLEEAYSWIEVTKMSPLSAIIFALMGTVLLLHSWHSLGNEKNTQQALVMCGTLCLCMLAITGGLWLAIKTEENNRLLIANQTMFSTEQAQNWASSRSSNLALFFGFIMSLLGILALYFSRVFQLQSIKLYQSLKNLKNMQAAYIEQEKLASLGSLTAGIAHEIRNPLNFIVNFAQISQESLKELDMALEGSKKQVVKEIQEEINELLTGIRSNLEVIMKQGKKANDTMQRMLDHARSQTGQWRTIAIASLVEEYLNLFWHSVKAKQPGFPLQIEKVFDPNLPDIYLVPEDISRVLINLLNNAFFAVNKKREQLGTTFNPKITISLCLKDKYLQISIQDNGIGIPEEVQHKLFTPFFTTKPIGEGTGLGLSLCYNIIQQQHNGKLSFESKSGEYTRFIILLPLEVAAQKEDVLLHTSASSTVMAKEFHAV